MLITGSGPIVVLTSHDSVIDAALPPHHALIEASWASGPSN
jgi:hypothetical protein